MALATVADNVRALVASYTLGSGSLTLTAVPAGMSSLSPAISSSHPIYITVATAGTYNTYPETNCVYRVTGLTVNTLTGLTVVSGTDTAFQPGDIVEMRHNAALFNDLAAAITASGTPPGGSTGNIQYNSASAFGGAANLNVGSGGQLNFGAITVPGSPANGDRWMDSAQGVPVNYDNSLANYRTGLIYNQIAKVTATTGTTSLVSTTGATGAVSLPAGYLNTAGTLLRVRAGGYGTNAASATGNITLIAKLGSSNIIATTQAQAATANAASCPWFANLFIVTKLVGSSGKLDCNGEAAGFSTGGVALFAAGMFASGTSAGTIAPQTQITLDLTAAYVFDFQIVLSASVNSFTLTNLTLEVLA